MPSKTVRVAACAVVTFAAIVEGGGQDLRSLQPADYGQFESLVVGSAGALSPDGRWLAYGINRSDRNNELRITSLRTDGLPADSPVQAAGNTTVVPFGTQAQFSADSRWAAFRIGLPEAQEEKLRADKKPIHNKAGILDLERGNRTTLDDIESFAFDASGSHLAMRRYPPEPEKKGSEPPPEPEGPLGATLVVRELSTGRDTTFGNVGEYAWQDKGRLLAITIATPDKTGNGVQVFDPENGTLRSLDSSSTDFGGLAWRKGAPDLAALRSRRVDGRDGPTETILAWTHLGEAGESRHTFEPASDANLPTTLRIVPFHRPSWSDDGRVVFAGIAKWFEAPPPAKNTFTGQDHGADAQTEVPERDEPAGVDVWHWRDVDVMPKQKLAAKTDRERSMLAAWHVDSGRLVQLGREVAEQLTPVRHQPFAYAANWSAYAMDRSIGRPAADLSLVDLDSGDRTKIRDRVNDRLAQLSPAGRYVLFFQDDHYWTFNTSTRAAVNITRTIATSFVNNESDETVKQKPPFGVAGWTAGDERVILYDKFDLWEVAPDGTHAVRLTNGAAEQVRHRYLRLDADEEAIDSAKPIYLSLFGIWSKKSGFARLTLPGAGAPPRVEPLVWLDKAALRFAKARNADVFQYSIETFDQPPVVLVGDQNLSGAKAVVRTNPFRDRYLWGRSEVVEYRTDRGEHLQSAVYYPAGYEPGKRYPTIVYLYERLSDGVHRWVSPSEREPYNIAAFTTLGYAVLEPDIAFRPREPGLSVVECVTPAVKKIVQMGVADPARVGVVGHSWGGFDTTFLATHTDIFAAAVAGAPITDLVSNYGNHHWSSGIAETDHIETGQQRMEVPLWEDLPAYIRNSAVFNAQNMKTPLLIEVGDGDGTVFWHQGIELYNVARRAKKNVVLLAYAGEDHGLRKRPNQLDYHRRIVEWFGHYLKGEPAPTWISEGVRYLDREREIKELNGSKPKT